ncbi:MAG: Uma2 family endonuclease [Leptolyngbyaceae cyanobacterium SM2_3_12]|nr:Uma2 family endonuclease [Leptolyngbyaceae cyanobacterium SM2_3_12]
MYDLPSEFPEEPGLPDEYHDLQPQLLSRTLTLTNYSREEWFAASDLNVYYDGQHPLWHKRPDWFLAVGVSRLYDGEDLRRSYVVWQEGASPAVVVEFLSPGTEEGDLGHFFEQGEVAGSEGFEGSSSAASGLGENSSFQDRVPPEKFVVYERYLRVPYYVVYDRYSGILRFFQLVADRYQEQPLLQGSNLKIWLPELGIGLGIWEGAFEGATRPWLRWCDQNGNWLLLDTEQERIAKEQERTAKERERTAKEQAQAQLVQAARNLLTKGMAIDEIVMLLELTEEQLNQVMTPLNGN